LFTYSLPLKNTYRIYIDDLKGENMDDSTISAINRAKEETKKKHKKLAKLCIPIVVLFLVVFVFNMPTDEILVRAGTFQMGDTQNDGFIWQTPVHTVNLTYDYYIGRYEVTNKSYITYLNESEVSSNGKLNTKKHIDMDNSYCEIGYANGGFYLKKGQKQAPVIEVTWWGAIGYCNWLSEKKGLPKAYDSGGNLLDKNGNKTTDITAVMGYRLPTEAEWEYAARGGHKSTGDSKYAGSNKIDEVAWYWDNSTNNTYPIYKGKGTHEVRQKTPNELGLYDMSGNVWEWCHDWFGIYTSDIQTNPIELERDPCRVARGGGWVGSDVGCRLSSRGEIDQSSSQGDLGFRIARTK